MHDILYSLLRTTLLLTFCGGVCFFALRKVEDRLPRLSRFLWLAVLLTGWFWIQPVVLIPWNENVQKIPSVVLTESIPEAVEFEPPPPVQHLELPVFREPISFATEPTIIARKSFDWKPLIFRTVFAVWIGGMVVSIFLAATGYVRFLSLLRKTVPAEDAWSEPWKTLLTKHGIDQQKIPMFVSNDLGPALVRTPVGYRLTVPQELWSELSEAGRSCILKHELEHFRRRDVWKSFFVRILALPHWFNPMAHLALHRFEEAAEVLCDRAAFDVEQRCPESVIVEFAETLLLLHENAPTRFVVRQSIFGRGLKHRVACLLRENNEQKVSVMKKILLIIGAVALLTACLFRVEFVEVSVAQSAQGPPRQQEENASDSETADLEKLQKEVDAAKKKLDAMKKLYEQNTISAEELYKAEKEWSKAGAALSEAKALAMQKDPAELAKLNKQVEEARKNYLDVHAKYVAGQLGGSTGDHADAQLKLAEAEIALYRFTGEKDRLLAALQTRADAARERTKFRIAAVKAGIKPATDTPEAEKKLADAEAELKAAKETTPPIPADAGLQFAPPLNLKINREVKSLEDLLVQSNKEVEAVRKALEEKKTTPDQLADAERRNRELVEEMNTYKKGEESLKAGRFQDAKPLLEKFVEKWPHDDSNQYVLYYLGEIAKQAGNVNEASHYFEQSIKLFPEGAKNEESIKGLNWCKTQIPPRPQGTNAQSLAVASDSASTHSVLAADRPDVRVYAVNKQTKDFPKTEDRSTPEAAVASKIREGADREKNPSITEEVAQSQWTAQIVEVRIFNERHAMVLVNNSYWKYKPLTMWPLEKKDDGWSVLPLERIESVEMFAAKFAGAIPRWEKEDSGQWVSPDKFQSTHIMVLAPKGDFKPRFMTEINKKLVPLWKRMYDLSLTNMKTWPENDDQDQKTLVVGIFVNDPEAVREVVEKELPDFFVQRIEKLNDKMYKDYIAEKSRNINGQFSSMDATQNTHVVVFTGKDNFKPKTSSEILMPPSQAMRKMTQPASAGWTQSWVEDGRLVGALLTDKPELMEKVVNEIPGFQVLRTEKLTEESLKEYLDRVSTGLDSKPAG